MTATENKTNIAKAIIAVMKEVKNIEKSMTVGSGQNSYKGVSDKDVKQIVGNAMQNHGLCIIPIGVEAKTQIERWEETAQFGNNPPVTKTRQSVHVEATTRYLLLHESGESIELSGYGHGVDSQDKAAGKATTYALKYALLYTFMVPTGKIDDADNEHSDEKSVPAPKRINYAPGINQVNACDTEDQLKTLWELNPEWKNIPEMIRAVADRKKVISQITQP